MKLTLFHYWRSSSSWRVRWALVHKGLAFDLAAVNLLSDEAESEAHRQRNPLGFVPALEFQENGAPPRYLTESMAIIEWVEETHPIPALLPGDAWQRAKIRELAQIIGADTQPLQNLSTLEMISEQPEVRKSWAQHWIRHGLEAYEQLVRSTAGKFSVGDSLTLADLFLIPQCYNAARFDVPVADYPTIARICQAAEATDGYRKSCPEAFRPA